MTGLAIRPAAGPTTRTPIREALRFCVVVFLLQRVLLQGIAVAVNLAAGKAPNSGPGFFGLLANWDSGYFTCIARNGYFGPACGPDVGVERQAFFPLYPLLGRGLGWVAGEGQLTSGAIAFGLWAVALVASFLALVALFLLVARTRGLLTARRASLLFAFGPYGLFLVASYSESLYLAGAVAAWYACLRRRYGWCAVFGAVATASRVSGLFLVPALLVLYLTSTRRDDRQFRVRELVLVASSGLGLLAFWGWLAFRTGDPLAWFHAQDEGWNRKTQWPWDTLINQGVHVLREPRDDWQVQAVLELLFAGGICLALALLVRQRDWAAVVLVGLTALSLMTSSYYLSLARNTLTLFPLVILLADLTRTRRRFALVAGAGFALLVFNTVQFSLGNWAD